jgi:phospholipid/cholesterol/gamma-HCH transport system ATP-binding protein
MIRFEGVSFSYGHRFVLDGVSFSIQAHERVAILGESGVGKTTILKLILGLIRPDSGKIYIDGEEIAGMGEEKLRHIRMKFSIVFQEGALFDSLNVKENVVFCLREYTRMSEEELDQKVRALLRIVGVEQAIDLMPEELSGGMHRRVAIARSLAACDPKTFLYDEPTSGLDPINADNICRVILDLSKNEKGLLIVTHKVIDALKVANRFLFLKEGAILLDGPADKLIHSTLPEVEAFLCELNFHLDSWSARIGG